MSRAGLERLTAALHERIGDPSDRGEDAGRVEALRRQVRHSVTGIDAYLSAVEAGSSTTAGLREQALDLWEALERIASAWPGYESAVVDNVARVPAQPAPRF
ncbi:hypothetical protein ACFVXG_27670 [Kitasatospora sp. NPDC058162]|uniref:hypothetical protein n=1 Tax=Kitasatospora sp. NPDC058162 TaxID=3346362 RepID=UPI0036D99B17